MSQVITLRVTRGLLLLGTGAVCWITWNAIPKSNSANRKSPQSRVAIELVFPATTPVTAAKSTPVEFRYRVSNRSGETLRGLELGVGCRCQLGLQLPTELKVRESALCSVTIAGATAGTRQEQIALRATGYSEPIGWLLPTIRVEASPPELVQPIAKLDWTRIEGDSVPNQIVIHAVELVGMPQWLSKCELRLRDEVLPIHWKAIDRQGDEPQFVFRRYEGTVNSDHLSVGRHHGTWQFTTNGPELPPVPCEILIQPELSLLPQRLEFREPDQSLRVTVVNRVGKHEIHAVWNEALLKVSPVERSTPAIGMYQVNWQADAPSDAETTVQFTVEGRDPLALLVTRKLR